MLYWSKSFVISENLSNDGQHEPARFPSRYPGDERQLILRFYYGESERALTVTGQEKLRGTHERNYGDRCLKGLKTPTGKWAKSRSLRVATVRP